MVKLTKFHFSFFLTGLILVGCSQSNNLTMKCDGKVSIRDRKNNQNVEMIFRIKDSKIYQLNNDGYLLITEDGMKCTVSEEIISCLEKKELDSVTSVERFLNIKRIDGEIKTMSKLINSKTSEIYGSDIYEGKCQKVTNTI